MVTQQALTELTPDEISNLPDDRKLEIICSLSGDRHDPQHDHRRYLSPPELDRLLILLQRRYRPPK